MSGLSANKKRKLKGVNVMNWLRAHMEYILFLCGLAFLSIMNSHVAEKKIRKIAYMKKEVKELNWKYLTIKSEWMNNSSLSNLEKNLEENSVGKEGRKPVILKSKKD